MKKALFVATVVKLHIKEFHMPYLKMLNEMGWEISVAARNDYEDPDECVIPFCDHFYDIPFERSPLKRNNITAYRKLKQLIDEQAYDLIHCHTPVGGVLARLAATDARKKGTKVFYTAHGFHFYSGAPLLNWLMYYPVEKMLARRTDVLLTINQEDYMRALRRFHACRTVYVPGVGIDIEKFRRRPDDGAQVRQELGIAPDTFLVLSVGELIPRKNYRLALDSLAECRQSPRYSSLLYLICGQGTLETELKAYAKEKGINDRVRFLGYRHDVGRVISACNLFLHLSRQEGLPVAIMEAMSGELPVIATDIRGNNDLIGDGSGFLVNEDRREIAEKILLCADNPELCAIMGKNALRAIQPFRVESVLTQVGQLYRQI